MSDTPRRRHCPIDGCASTMKATEVLCRSHWFSVPMELRQRVWRLYRRSPGSGEHLEAVMEAVSAAERRQA